jgi:hypothetical protein
MKHINMLILALFLTACGADPEQFIKVEGTQAEEIETFVGSYKEEMIEAVNTGDFNKLESYLITNNSFYHSLRRYVTDMHSEGTTKALNTFEVETVYEDEIGEYHVDVNETVTLFEHGQEKKIDRAVRIDVVRGKTGTLRIVTIKERK